VVEPQGAPEQAQVRSYEHDSKRRLFVSQTSKYTVEAFLR